jgi:uncharacterized membrane protein
MVSVQKPKFAKILPWVLVVTGIIGLVCSLVLTHDQIKIWQDPSYIPACSLNPVVSCGSVINSNQGHIFNIPAPFFGLLLFPVLITLGTVLLAGAQIKRWFWLVIEIGAVVGFLFAIWLFFLSVYRIHALCPFCLVTDVAVYTAAWYITLYNIEKGFIQLPKSTRQAGDFVRRHHIDGLIIWLLLLLIFILHHFWYYYGKHLCYR